MNIKGHMKRNLVIILVVLSLIGGLTVSLAVGGSEQGEALAQENQTATVQRGDLSVEINAAGNLALSQTEDLAFDMAGTVVEVLVEEGDSVVAGQELAKLDTTEWDKQLKTLERALGTAQRNLTTKENEVIKAERKVTASENDLTKAEREVSAKELDVIDAQITLQTAEYNLSEINEVKTVQDTIDEAEYVIKFANSILSGQFGGGIVLADAAYWYGLKIQAEDELAQAQEDLQDVLDGSGLPSDVAIQVAKYQLQVKKAEIALEDAQIAVGDARIAVEDAKQSVVDAKLDLENARQELEDAPVDLSDAQSDLDEAKALSPIITAPFD